MFFLYLEFIGEFRRVVEGRNFLFFLEFKVNFSIRIN